MESAGRTRTTSSLRRLPTSDGDLRSMKRVVDECARARPFVEAPRLRVHPLGLVPLTERRVSGRQVVSPARGVLDQASAVGNVERATQICHRLLIGAIQQVRGAQDAQRLLEVHLRTALLVDLNASPLDCDRSVEISQPRVTDARIPQANRVHHERRQIGHGDHGFEERQRLIVAIASRDNRLRDSASRWLRETDRRRLRLRGCRGKRCVAFTPPPQALQRDSFEDCSCLAGCRSLTAALRRRAASSNTATRLRRSPRTR